MSSSSPTEVLSADPDLLTGPDPFVDGTPPPVPWATGVHLLLPSLAVHTCQTLLVALHSPDTTLVSLIDPECGFMSKA